MTNCKRMPPLLLPAICGLAVLVGGISETIAWSAQPMGGGGPSGGRIMSCMDGRCDYCLGLGFSR
jgi:hypothetical protein